MHHFKVSVSVSVCVCVSVSVRAHFPWRTSFRSPDFACIKPPAHPCWFPWQFLIWWSFVLHWSPGYRCPGHAFRLQCARSISVTAQSGSRYSPHPCNFNATGSTQARGWKVPNRSSGSKGLGGSAAAVVGSGRCNRPCKSSGISARLFFRCSRSG